MCKQLGKIDKTKIVFKIGGLTEENFAYAQQEIKVVLVSSAHYGVVKLALKILIFGSGLGLGLAVVEIVLVFLLTVDSVQLDIHPASVLVNVLSDVSDGHCLYSGHLIWYLTGLSLGQLVDDSFRYQQFRLFDADVCRVR
ncbi:hypothetical protein PPACK8108_LOCUS16149 [Phakopsora pachyrhizi]|uniref:Uncharacterized protein n=1 Tax=Phakopsora pachyrhizi TaxID=170000 RepID=A0AAV0BB10_PHAPC|nr:hypothetical protein PPACK8108_LOCUS16149 [Phakopsora pachyrhizi]